MSAFFEKGKFFEIISALLSIPRLIRNFFWVVFPLILRLNFTEYSKDPRMTERAHKKG